MGFVELTEVLGNVGEFLGSVAVLVTLVYLAVQVRHSRTLLEENRKIALGQVHGTRADILLRQQEAMLEENVAEAVALVRSNTQAGVAEGLSRQDAFTRAVEGLSKADRLRLTAVNQMSIWSFDYMAYQDELALLNEESQAMLGQGDWEFTRHRWETLGCLVTPRLRRVAGMDVTDA